MASDFPGAFAVLRAILKKHADGMIVLTRPGQPERRLNYFELRKENDPERMIHVEPGDVIDVP